MDQSGTVREGSGTPNREVPVPCLCSRAARMAPRCCRSCSPRSWQRPPCPPSPPSHRPSRHTARRRSPRNAMRTCARKPSSKSTKKAVLPEGGQMYAVDDGERRQLEPRLQRSLVPGPQLVQDQQRQRPQRQGPLRRVVRLRGNRAVLEEHALQEVREVRRRVAAHKPKHVGDQEGHAARRGLCPRRVTRDRRQLVDGLRRRHRFGHVVVPDRLRDRQERHRPATA